MQIKKRFGIGELVGRDLLTLTPEQRAELASKRLSKGVLLECPPKVSCAAFDPNAIPRGGTNCTKSGGICSVREYKAEFETQSTGSLRLSTVEPVGSLRTICPHRFLEAGTIYSWVGEEILKTPSPQIVRELKFLESGGKAIGRIDCVLVHPTESAFTWCAVEMQAVYLSNSETKEEVGHLASSVARLPFPVANPRPDYRSSGPKRLLPQLQIKGVTLSRWGIKMAVVVDQDFFENIGRMEQANDPSNADIAWFVVRYARQPDGGASLERAFVHYTTLPAVIKGLVGGESVPRTVFEKRIREKLAREYKQA
jgi:hypothetical protein